MTSVENPIQVTLGGLLVSVLIATFLYAINCFQTFLYWRSKFNDRFAIRLLVWIVWLFESCHSLCFWIYLFIITVNYYGEPKALEERHWSVCMSVVFHGCLTGSVQAYYSYRAYVLSGGRKLVPVLCWIGCLFQGFGSIGAAILLYLVGPVTLNEQIQLFPTLIIAMDLAVGVVNTITLCYYLHARRTGIKTTDQTVSALIQWIVETGLITAFAALGMIIACIVTPDTAVYISMTSFYAKFFSNSLLASLNGRGPFSPFRAPSSGTMINVVTEIDFQVTDAADTTGNAQSIQLSALPGAEIKSKASGVQPLASIAEHPEDVYEDDVRNRGQDKDSWAMAV